MGLWVIIGSPRNGVGDKGWGGVNEVLEKKPLLPGFRVTQLVICQILLLSTKTPPVSEAVYKARPCLGFAGGFLGDRGLREC